MVKQMAEATSPIHRNWTAPVVIISGDTQIMLPRARLRGLMKQSDFLVQGVMENMDTASDFLLVNHGSLCHCRHVIVNLDSWRR